MFASSPVFDHFKLIKKAVTVRFDDLKNGAANNLKVDSIRELGLTADNRTFTVRRVFIDMPKSDRFLEVGWVLNENIPCCLTCFKDFGTFTRRHHCRGCGTLMCKSCSYNSLIEGFPALKKQIVCKKCMSEVSFNLIRIDVLNDLFLILLRLTDCLRSKAQQQAQLGYLRV